MLITTSWQGCYVESNNLTGLCGIDWVPKARRQIIVYAPKYNHLQPIWDKDAIAAGHDIIRKNESLQLLDCTTDRLVGALRRLNFLQKRVTVR